MNMTHRIVDGEVCQKLLVHRFSIGDVDDPEIYAAEPIYNWQQTEAGKFVMENAVTKPELHHQSDYLNYGYQYAITAWLKDRDATYFCLRWK
jgi:hypothetical protein